MKTHPLIPFALCLLLPCANVAGQEQKVQEPKAQAPIILPSIDKDALSIVATVNTTKYIYGENLALDVVFTNKSDKDLQFFLNAPDEFFNIDMRFVVDGKSVPLATSIVNSLGREYGERYRMRPNGTLRGRIWLNTMFDLSLQRRCQLKVSKTFSAEKDGSKPFTVAADPIDIEVISGARRPIWY